MSTPSALPRHLEDWIRTLDAVPLPLDGQAQDQALQALSDASLSLRDIADAIEPSPALVLLLMREANRGHSEPAASLEPALTRLGLNRCQILVRGQPRLDVAAMPRALCQLLLVSQHAMQQADGLFGSRLGRLYPDIHCGSLLFLAPLWPLACAYPELLLQWQQRVLVKGERAAKVEHELLGVRVRELCLGLAEHWRLPPWIELGHRLLGSDRRLLVKALRIARDYHNPLLQQQRLDQDPSLRRWLTQPSNTLLLANGLAAASHAAWDDQHSLRWQGLTALYLQQPIDEVQQRTHQLAAQSARRHALPGVWHPAAALLWPPGRCHLREVRTPPPSASDLQTWRQHCAQLLRQPSPFRNLLQLTECARLALAACGVQRLMLLLSDHHHSQLQAVQTHGLAAHALQLRLTLGQHSVLQQLLIEPGQLALSADNFAQYSAQLPGELKQLVPGANWVLRPLSSQGRGVLLLVASSGDYPFHGTSLQALDKTAQCIERGLQQFLSRGR